jgi:hypothetical protein
MSQYLNMAIADDFPAPLPRASYMYAPGRVPLTGEHHLLVHEHNLAWLAHAALLQAREGSITPQLTYVLGRRVCRLLLIVNDFFAEPIPSIPGSLTERQAFAVNWLRNGQFNYFSKQLPASMLDLARQHILLCEILPRYFAPLHDAFLEATGGVSLQQYFEILTLFMTFFHHELAAGKHWFLKDQLCEAIPAGRELIERLLVSWIQTPDGYRQSWTAWNQQRPPTGYVPCYDFVLLREKPFIEARPGELVCPVIPLLLAKIVDGPYFILSDHLPIPQKTKFQQALRLAYEKYAQGLV